MADASRQHRHSIKSHRNAGALGKPGIQCGQERLVDGRAGLAPFSAKGKLRVEAAALFRPIGKLAKAVGYLDALDELLEAARQVAFVQSGQCRLFGGVIHDQGSLAAAQVRRHGERERQVDQRRPC